MISSLITTCLLVLASHVEAQTLRKFANHRCQGAVAVCSVRTDVGRSQNWPQATCCQKGVMKSGSLRISGVQGSVGEISIAYRGNFNTQCSVQDSVYLGSPTGCVQGRALGTGVWLSCPRQYATGTYNQNCSAYKKKRQISANTTGEAAELGAPGNTTDSDDEQDLEIRPHDPDWLPSGFYDALENPISEDEYWLQIAWEEQHGVPYAIAMQYEQEHGVPYTIAIAGSDALENRAAGGLSIYTYGEDQCRGERLRHVTRTDHCYASVDAVSLFVDALADNCNVVTYTDEHCKKNPYTNVQAVQGVGAAGCYTGDNYNSISVTCS